MPKRIDVDYIEDILESAERIMVYTGDMEYATFLLDKKTQDAVIRNIQILGEATKTLSEDIRQKNPQIPWRNMAGTRDKLVHDYFGVNVDIVWHIATKEIPQLILDIKNIRSAVKGS